MRTARTRQHLVGLAIIALLAISATQGDSGAIRTGKDYVKECASAEDADKRDCRDPIFGEVLALQGNQSRQPNPFARCPVEIFEPDAFADVLEKLQLAVVGWLKKNPAMQDEPMGGLVRIALREIDVCAAVR